MTIYKNPLILIKNLERYIKINKKIVIISDYRSRYGYIYGYYCTNGGDPFDILKQNVINFLKANPKYKHIINKKIINIRARERYLKHLTRNIK